MLWLSPRNFSKSEIAGMLGGGMILGLLSLVPYFVFAHLTPVHRIYLWSSTFYFDDYFQYYAWANRVADGDWLIRNYYTHDPNTSFALFNPFFLVLGWTTRLCGNMFAAYHAVRVVAILLFAWVAYAFTALFLERPRDRLAACALLLAGGLEYPWFFLAAKFGVTRYPTPLADPYTFKIIYRYGHLTVCLTALLVALGSHWRQTRIGRQTGNLILLALSTGVLGSINPYYLVLLGAVIAADSVVLMAKEHTLVLAPGLAAGAAAFAVGTQYFLQPITSQLGDIAFDDPIGPVDLTLFFGLLAPVAVLGFIWAQRSGRNLLLLQVWVLVVVLLVLTPLRFRARMVLGVQFAFAIPAAIWLGHAWRFVPARLLIVPLILMEIAFTFYKEALDFNGRNIGTLERSFLAALEELDRRALPGDVILSAPLDGIIIPAFTRASVYIGHSFQTPDYYGKRALVTRFFLDMPPEDRAGLLHSIAADFVLIPPMRDDLAATLIVPGWKQVYSESGYKILEPDKTLFD